MTEPKRTPTYKELIERIATEYAKRSSANVFQLAHKEDFIAGAKWQSEQTQSELESLRSENAELIEALSATLPILNDVVHEQIDWVRIIVRITLAKYEKP